MNTVLHVIHTGGPGGAETVVMNLACGMLGSPWRPAVTIPYQGWLGATLTAGGVQPAILPDNDRMAYVRGLMQLVRRERVDLIHAHLLGSATYASLVSILCGGVPVIATFHGHSDITPDKPLETVRFALLRRVVSRIVLVSEPLQQTLQATGRIPTAATEVIPNGVDTSVFRPMQDHSFRRELGFPDDAFVVGAVGNLRPAKDYPNLLRAAALLVKSAPNYRFVIAGQGGDPLRGELLQLRSQLGLDEHVVFAGFQTDVPRVLNSYDAMVISSSQEGFSLAAIQAMACGVPVVATRCGGPEQIIEHDRDGTLVPTGDAVALATAVGQLRSQPDRARDLATRARATVQERFSFAGTLSRYESLYSNVLAARRA